MKQIALKKKGNSCWAYKYTERDVYSLQTGKIPSFSNEKRKKSKISGTLKQDKKNHNQLYFCPEES